MNIQPDFEDFLKLLESHEVDYMIVGGYAVAFHGFPRFTKDIDVFFELSPIHAVFTHVWLLVNFFWACFWNSRTARRGVSLGTWDEQVRYLILGRFLPTVRFCWDCHSGATASLLPHCPIPYCPFSRAD